MDAKQRTVAVTYRRQVSDGNYGTESAEVHLEWFVDDDNDSHADLEFAQEMLSNATDIALNHLRGSLNRNVRQAVSPPRPIAPPRTAATVGGGDEAPF